MRVTHPRLARALRRGVRWAEAERTFIVELHQFRGWLDVEDTAFFVDAYREETGEVELSDQTREPLDTESLTADPDDCLRCLVKGRFPARFTHGAQEQLLDAIEIGPTGISIRAGGSLRSAPRLEV